MSKVTNKREQGTSLNSVALKLTPIATGCAILLATASGATFAQVAPDPAAKDAESAPATIVVTGIRRGIEAAISVKQNNSSIVEAISAEDIGKLPDTTIAESLARLPGLTTQRTRDGNASTVSIRGLGPDFNGYLLNGREQTSTGDSRAVDLSVYPSELIAGATVYKTSDAGVVGQGLAGTIDQNLIDPLAFPGRVLSANIQRNRTGVGLDKKIQGTGNRKSFTYIDQFADRKIGVALGFVRADGGSSQNQVGHWGSSNGQTATLTDGTVVNNVSVPNFGNGISGTTRRVEDERTGVAAILAYKPSKNFISQLDLFYSQNDNFLNAHRITGGLGGPITNATVSNGVVTSGTYSGVNLINYNEGIQSDSKLKSIGWKNTLKMANGWVGMLDLSKNSATRIERDVEYYAGLVNPSTLSFTTVNGQGKFTSGASLTDASTMAMRDQGWSGIAGVPQAGYSKGPNVKDEVTSFRLDAKKELDGSMFSDVHFGINQSNRTKARVTNEGVIASATGTGFDRFPFPAGSTPGINIGGTGLDALEFDANSVLIPGSKLVRKYNNDILSKTYTVEENVTTAFAKAGIDTEWAKIPVRGNVGAQLIRTQQSALGFQAQVGSDPVLTDPSVGGKLTKSGTTYTDVLPSLNLTADFGSGTLLRFGLSKELARPTLSDLRNSFSVSSNLAPTTGNDKDANGLIRQRFEGSKGNPNLKPYRADALDLSIDKYIGKKAYVSGAAFYKKLNTYIVPSTNENYDFSSVVPFFGLAPQIGTPLNAANPTNKGVLTQTVNGTGGSLQGFELSGSAPFNIVSDWLDGFGANASYSHTTSSVKLPNLIGANSDANANNLPTGSIPLPGLSKDNAKLQLYFEKAGFSVFVANNFRSRYVGSVAGSQIGGAPALQWIGRQNWISAQAGYEFSQGYLKGLSVRVEGSNLNSPEYREFGPTGNETTYTKTGRQLNFTLSYKLQ